MMTKMDKTLIALHDRLLSERPEGASHDDASCPICAGDVSHTDPEVAMSDKTYTEEEVAAKIVEATKPLEQRISELETSHEQAEVDRRIAEATKPLEDKVAELEADLDKATLRAEEAEAKVQESEKFWQDLATELAEEAERQERREARVAQVKEHANFSDEYIEKRADSWASMSDEDFAQVLEDWKAISAANDEGEGGKSTIPPFTSMKGSSERRGVETAAALVRDLNRKGVDPRKMR